MPLIAIIISRYWKPLAIAALLAAALAYRALLIHQRDQARAAVAQLSSETAALRASNQALAAAIDRQNAAVAQLKNEADAAVNAMAANERAAASAGAAAQSQAEQQARALAAAPIDSTSGCEGAIQWANGQAPELAAW